MATMAMDNEVKAVFFPEELDIICGSGKSVSNHPGNRRFRLIVMKYCNQYYVATTKAQKMKVNRHVMEELKLSGSTRFLKKDPIFEKFYIATNRVGRDKISHCLRELKNETQRTARIQQFQQLYQSSFPHDYIASDSILCLKTNNEACTVTARDQSECVPLMLDTEQCEDAHRCLRPPDKSYDVENDFHGSKKHAMNASLNQSAYHGSSLPYGRILSSVPSLLNSPSATAKLAIFPSESASTSYLSCLPKNHREDTLRFLDPNQKLACNYLAANLQHLRDLPVETPEEKNCAPFKTFKPNVVMRCVDRSETVGLSKFRLEHLKKK